MPSPPPSAALARLFLLFLRRSHSRSRSLFSLFLFLLLLHVRLPHELLPPSVLVCPCFGRHYRSLVSCLAAGAKRCVGSWALLVFASAFLLLFLPFSTASLRSLSTLPPLSLHLLAPRHNFLQLLNCCNWVFYFLLLFKQEVFSFLFPPKIGIAIYSLSCRPMHPPVWLRHYLALTPTPIPLDPFLLPSVYTCAQSRMCVL